MNNQEEQFSLEENFARLEQAIDRLGDDDLPLEEAFETYSQGMKLLMQCNEQIDRVEKQVLKLSADGRLEEFGDAE